MLLGKVADVLGILEIKDSLKLECVVMIVHVKGLKI